MLLKKYVTKSSSSLNHKYKLARSIKNIPLDDLIGLKEEVKNKISELDKLLASNDPSIHKVDVSEERYHYNVLFGKISDGIIKIKRENLKMSKKALNSGGVYLYDDGKINSDMSGVIL